MPLLAEQTLLDAIDSPGAMPAWEESAAHRLTLAIVSKADAEHYTVVDTLSHPAQRAASCLTLPTVGDSVLVARSEDSCWIVAVLVAAGERQMAFQGPVVRIATGEFSIDTETMRSSSRQWQATHGCIDLTAGETRAHVGLVEWIGQKLTSWFDLCYSRHRRLLREVSEIESVKCGSYDLRVSEAMLLSAENSIITSQALTKVDGAQIQVG